MKEIKPIELSRHRRKASNEEETQAKFTNFLSLAGSLNFIGHGALPVAAFASSHLQQRIGNLKVKDLKEGNSILNEIRSLKPIIHYNSPPETFEAKLLAFSDGAQGT